MDLSRPFSNPINLICLVDYPFMHFAILPSVRQIKFRLIRLSVDRQRWTLNIIRSLFTCIVATIILSLWNYIVIHTSTKEKVFYFVCWAIRQSNAHTWFAARFRSFSVSDSRFYTEISLFKCQQIDEHSEATTAICSDMDHTSSDKRL